MNDTYGERLRWIEHDGNRILYTDYSNLRGSELVELMSQCNEYIIKAGREEGDGLLVLTNITGAVVGTDAVSRFRKSLDIIGPYTKAGAQIGTEGMKKHILRFLNESSPFHAKAFDRAEDAKEWLARQTF